MRLHWNIAQRSRVERRGRRNAQPDAAFQSTLPTLWPARKRTAIAAALLLVQLVLAAAPYQERITHWWRWGVPLPLAPDLERLLAWLPEDMQTLIVARDAVVRSRLALAEAPALSQHGNLFR